MALEQRGGELGIRVDVSAMGVSTYSTTVPPSFSISAFIASALAMATA